MAEKQNYDVFLSYSNEDRPWATEFASALKDAGVKTWFDAHELKPGERWQEKIEEALRDSRIFVLILSPEGLQSPWTYFELGAALADQKRIIPVAAEDIDLKQVPPLLRQFQFVKEPSAREAGRQVAEVLEKREAA